MTTRRPPPLAAPVDGYAAWRIARFLQQHDFAAAIEREERRGVHPDQTAGLRITVAKIAAAGQEWQDRRILVDTSTQIGVTEISPRSAQEITPEQAATLLKVTPERVRQLLRAGILEGRKIGRVWLTSREEVETYRDGREVA